MLVGSLLFVIISVLMLVNASSFKSPIFQNEVLILVVGILGLVFFGFCTIFIIKAIFSQKIMLTISESGIEDRSSGVSIGLIEWQDIVGIETRQIYSQKFVVLLTSQPDKYLDKANSTMKRKAMQANARLCGSPLAISSNSLKINHADLETMLNQKWENYRIGVDR